MTTVSLWCLSSVAQMSLDEPISKERQAASQLYKRIAGVRAPIDSPRLIVMEKLIKEGRYMDAAEVPASKDSFYNITVKTLAAEMSTREETPRAPFSDFVATFVGAVRDELDARTLLYGNYYYRAREGTSGVRGNLVADILKSNAHYTDIENSGHSLKDVLVKVEGQKLLGPRDSVHDHPDPAGLITSRQFMASHAVAGTNRRLVEYSFRQFSCLTIDDWKTTSAPDLFVGMDVDRFPGGSNAEYMSTCKACHSVMDAFRPAFAFVDFSNDFVKHSQIIPAGQDEQEIDADPNRGGVVNKLNQNEEYFPDGYEVTNANWRNHLMRNENSKLFGWSSGAGSGSGMQSFGRAIAGSESFGRCMVKRVFQNLCRRDPVNQELPLLEKIRSEFEAKGFNLKWLFKSVATQDDCVLDRN